MFWLLPATTKEGILKQCVIICLSTESGTTVHTGHLEHGTQSPRLTPDSTCASAACPVGYFKMASGSVPCTLCPSNSRTSQEGALTCECRSSFYRAPTDINSSACTSKTHLCLSVCLCVSKPWWLVCLCICVLVFVCGSVFEFVYGVFMCVRAHAHVHVPDCGLLCLCSISLSLCLCLAVPGPRINSFFVSKIRFRAY